MSKNPRSGALEAMSSTPDSAGPTQGVQAKLKVKPRSIDEVSGFLSDNGYTFPVVMDTTGDVLSAYGISAFPTTFMIDTEGNVFGYVTGQLTADMMESIVTQTMTGQRVS